MNKEAYIQATSRIRMQEKKLITPNKFMQLIEAENLEKVKQLLSDTVYSDYLSEIGLVNYEKMLKKEENKLNNLFLELTHNDTTIIDYFLLEREYQNLKLRIKHNKYNEKIKYHKMILSSPELRERLEKEYTLLENLYEDTKDFQTVSIKCDLLFLNTLEQQTKQLKIDFLNEYLIKKVEKYNLLTMLRMKKLNKPKIDIQNTLYPYEDIDVYIKYYEMEDIKLLKRKFNNIEALDVLDSTGNISKLEKSLDNEILYITSKAKQITYGAEVLIAYYLSKQYEMKALRLILTAKINNISNDIIKDRMRGTYV